MIEHKWRRSEHIPTTPTAKWREADLRGIVESTFRTIPPQGNGATLIDLKTGDVILHNEGTMRSLLCGFLLFAGVSVVLNSSAQAACSPVSGADALLWKRSVPVVWVGEMHGTAETPAAFGDLVCDALAHGKNVTVGLELASQSQAALDAILEAGDLEAAKRQLLAMPNWHMFFDGRSSQAMLALLVRMRGLKTEYPSLRVVAIENPWENTAGAKEAAVGKGVEAVVKHGPADGLLVLTGNMHAMKHSPVAYPTAASLLPPADVFSLLVTARGGKSWQMTGIGCGAQPNGIQDKDITRTFGVYADAAYAKYGFDGVFALGKSTTASPPADEAAAEMAECRKQFLAQPGASQLTSAIPR